MITNLDYSFVMNIFPFKAASLVVNEAWQIPVKGLRHVPYAAALKQLQLFSLVCRRIRGDHICMFKMMHSLLNFPCDTVLVASTRTGLRGHSFKIHKQRCKTRRRQHAFSVRVNPYWNKLPEEIASTLSLETFKLRLDARWQSIFPEAPPLSL